MAKKKMNIFKLLALIFIFIPLGFVLLLVTVFIISMAVRGAIFDNTKTKVTKDGIELVTPLGTASMGSHFSCNIYGDEAVVLEDIEEVTKGILTGTSMKNKYKLKAVSAGTSFAVVVHYTGGMNINDCSIYKITVNEDLDVTYELRKHKGLYRKYKGLCIWAHEGDELQTADGNTIFLTEEQVNDIAIPYYGQNSDVEEVPQKGLYVLKVNNRTYSFDLENGKIYSVNDTFIIDEELLPYYKELFAKIS